MTHWPFVFLAIALAFFFGSILLVASDPCARRDIATTKFGTRAICEEVRRAQAEGLELHDCVKQDGHTYCIMIDRTKGARDADLP